MHLTPDVTEADRGVPLGTTRRVSTVFAGVLLLAVAGVALAVRYVLPTNHLTIFAVVASPFLMADFNATIDMSPFRGLLTEGYRDANEQAGAGRQFTYPGDRHIPPFMGIDHVLTHNGTAISTQTVTIAGSDHRALLATVMLPPG